ncbi:MAG: alpha-L-fucosidase [Mucilaginibacter sp.]|uniref:alpha-L-fucosidase n=1 Tax=Mucilaginibacter sp. TaxID=1882438 RepID=UPI003266E8D3
MRISISNFKKRICTLTILLAVLSVNAQAKNSQAAVKDFMDLRLGLFIHWGPVSLRGTEIGWSRGNQVATEDYDNLYKEFDPVLFDADAIVKTAKDAGMKYLTITARHHDGFCLWPTKFNNHNIKNSPYKKDIVGALNEACKKQGIKFCIYYSVLDWWHPDYPNNASNRTGIDNPNANMDKYILYMKNQLKELITNYDPYMLWFDGQWEKPWTNEMGIDMYKYLKTLKPNVIINNRLGKEFASTKNNKIDASKMVGDFDTPEQVVGRLNMETPWESCFTICNQWSWKPNDKMKTLAECLSILCKTVGSNGNLLLNVGPMPDGRIEARQISRLKEIGDWVKTNGEAIYGTLGGPYQPNTKFSTTRKGNKIYLCVLGSETATIQLKNIPDRKLVKAYTINGNKVTIENGQNTFNLTTTQSKIPYIIILEFNASVENVAVIDQE